MPLFYFNLRSRMNQIWLHFSNNSVFICSLATNNEALYYVSSSLIFVRNLTAWSILLSWEALIMHLFTFGPAQKKKKKLVECVMYIRRIKSSQTCIGTAIFNYFFRLVSGVYLGYVPNPCSCTFGVIWHKAIAPSLTRASIIGKERILLFASNCFKVIWAKIAFLLSIFVALDLCFIHFRLQVAGSWVEFHKGESLVENAYSMMYPSPKSLYCFISVS